MMEMRIYTLHTKKGREIEAISDGVDWLALIFAPAWMVWNRLWGCLVLWVVLLIATGFVTPLGVMPALSGLGLICGFEGGQLKRWERSFFGWQEVGVVEARSDAGAEELFLSGKSM